MEHGKRRSKWVREVAGLSASQTRDGVFVTVRCTEIAGPDHSRYEIVLEGHGERAVVDVPGGEAASLERRIEEAVGAFVGAVRLRSGVGGS